MKQNNFRMEIKLLLEKHLVGHALFLTEKRCKILLVRIRLFFICRKFNNLIVKFSKWEAPLLKEFLQTF